MQDFRYSNSQYHCRRCGEVLTAPLERRDGDWVLPCWICGVKNIVQPLLEIVGWRP